MIELRALLPAAEQGWLLLLELDTANRDAWVLIGGQMVFVLAIENGTQLPRATADMDVVVDVRLFQGGTEWLAYWLVDHGFTQDKPSTDGISHRFSRQVIPEAGTVIFDILAPDGLSEATDVTTVPPGRTVQTPGGTQGLNRARRVELAVNTADGRRVTGNVSVPDLLGALVLKAAATAELTVRENPIRDWADCALLLAMLPDPFATAAALTRGDRRRIGRLTDLRDRAHPGWDGLSDNDYRAGTTALNILLDQ